MELSEVPLGGPCGHARRDTNSLTGRMAQRKYL